MNTTLTLIYEIIKLPFSFASGIIKIPVWVAVILIIFFVLLFLLILFLFGFVLYKIFKSIFKRKRTVEFEDNENLNFQNYGTGFRLFTERVPEEDVSNQSFLGSLFSNLLNSKKNGKTS